MTVGHLQDLESIRLSVFVGGGWWGTSGDTKKFPHATGTSIKLKGLT